MVESCTVQQLRVIQEEPLPMNVIALALVNLLL